MRRRGLATALAAVAAAGALPAGASAATARAPRLSAPAAILVESSTGRAFWSRRANEERAIASTTKLMTVHVALQRFALSRVLTAPLYPTQAAESQIGLRAGERMTVADLVRAVMLPSANDAANALAVRAGNGSKARFVAQMNREARQLGLRHTHYETPVGLDTPGNYSTAADLAKLARIDRRNAFLRGVMDRRRLTLRSGDHPRTVVNRNTVVDDVPWANGVKTGHTSQAGYVLVASGTQHGLTFVSAVLGTPSEAVRDADSLALLRWGFATFRWAEPVRRRQAMARVAVKHKAKLHIALVASQTIRRLVRRGRPVRVRVRAPHELEGPLPRGAIVGRITVRSGGRVIGRAKLLTARRVPEVTLAARAYHAVGGGATLVAIGLAGALALLLVRRRAAARRRRRRERRRPGPETA